MPVRNQSPVTEAKDMWPFARDRLAVTEQIAQVTPPKIIKKSGIPAQIIRTPFKDRFLCAKNRLPKQLQIFKFSPIPTAKTISSLFESKTTVFNTPLLFTRVDNASSASKNIIMNIFLLALVCRSYLIL
jgi:hypothetical protein